MQNEQVRQRIGNRIATLRKLQGLTQAQLADRAGLQRTHVIRIEGGRYAVTIDVLQAIAQALGMTLDIIDPALQDLAPLRRLTPEPEEVKSEEPPPPPDTPDTPDSHT